MDDLEDDYDDPTGDLFCWDGGEHQFPSAEHGERCLCMECGVERPLEAVT